MGREKRESKSGEGVREREEGTEGGRPTCRSRREREREGEKERERGIEGEI